MKHKVVYEMNFTKLTYVVISLKDMKMFKVALLGLWAFLFLFLYLLNVNTGYFLEKLKHRNLN